MVEIEKFGIFELDIEYAGDAAYIEDCASFSCGNHKIVTGVFRKGDGYAVRFSPDREGLWEYCIMKSGMATCSGTEADSGIVADSNTVTGFSAAILGTEADSGIAPNSSTSLYPTTATVSEAISDNTEVSDGVLLSGSFLCVPCKEKNHGRVFASGDQFAYEDGTTYYPFGTTCYAWINQTKELQEQTVETLGSAPFNKIRMCIFPKSMPYNNNEPDYFPFEKDGEGWDIGKPIEVFWENLDLRLAQLLELGIEADLILFHPYDRWGFASLTQEESLAYLHYCILRLAPYRNVWWSLANEYDTVYDKSVADFDEYGELLQKKDIYHHLISVHNMIPVYQDRGWMTHCSIQSGDLDLILRWKEEHSGKPVIVDEFGYEGDLEYGWGNLSAFEEVHRFWKAVMRGGFATHGETFHREDEVLWWAKGGMLYGESPKRIAFFKELLYELPGGWHTVDVDGDNPNFDEMDEKAKKQAESFQELLRRSTKEDRYRFQMACTPMEIEGEGFKLLYFGRSCPCRSTFELDKPSRIELIDVWEMTREMVTTDAVGHVVVQLPGKEGMALLVMEE